MKDLLKCPLCRGILTEICIEAEYSNSFMKNKDGKWEMMSTCPDQGDVFFDCEHCGVKVTVSGTISSHPDDWEQEELNDMNGEEWHLEENKNKE
jgi:hypothetical protein